MSLIISVKHDFRISLVRWITNTCHSNSTKNMQFYPNHPSKKVISFFLNSFFQFTTKCSLAALSNSLHLFFFHLFHFIWWTPLYLEVHKMRVYLILLFFLNFCISYFRFFFSASNLTLFRVKSIKSKDINHWQKFLFIQNGYAFHW